MWALHKICFYSMKLQKKEKETDIEEHAFLAFFTFFIFFILFFQRLSREKEQGKQNNGHLREAEAPPTNAVFSWFF